MHFKCSLLIGVFLSALSAHPQEQAFQIVQESKTLNQKDVLGFIESLSHVQKPQLMNSVLPAQSNKACQGQVASQNNKEDEILIFVSFSMPEETLRGLFQGAQKYNARLILRGLIEDSFNKTQQKLQKLQINVDIDPNLFEEHYVTHVPTFIKTHKNHVYKLSGNVSLAYVQEQFAKAIGVRACS